MKNPKYSIIVPVYNRPQEIEELLNSLTIQTYTNFEVLVIEDGSSVRCDHIVDRYRDKLNIQYYFKPNSGPGPARNFGFTYARGDYFVVFDSDCIIPPEYFSSVEKFVKEEKLDAWGGPDAAHKDFTPLQQAMGYTMSSFLTTGGIRGGKKHVGWFQPRSFNMGISRLVFEKTNGFAFTHLAEDIELSIRMKQQGFRVKLIPEAFVYHKRRTNLKEFYHQVKNFGKGRVMVGRIHPHEVKLTHWFPSLFFLGAFISLLLFPFSPDFSAFLMTGYLVYFLLVFLHAFLITQSFNVALLSVPSSAVQLFGYGIGFLKEWAKPYTGK